jgi:hypothetical protein
MSRYVITYDGTSDPTAEEEGKLVSALGSVRLVDRFPGSLLVEGSEFDLVRAVAQVKGWSFGPVAQAEVNPPRRPGYHTGSRVPVEYIFVAGTTGYQAERMTPQHAAQWRARQLEIYMRREGRLLVLMNAGDDEYQEWRPVPEETAVR